MISFLKRNFFIGGIVFLLVGQKVLFALEYDKDKHKPKTVGMGYIIIGGNSLDMNALNASLERLGLDSFHNRTFSFGIGIQGISRKLIIGGEGCMLSAHKETDNSLEKDIQSRITGAFGFFDFGFMLVSKDRFRFYPMIGCGYGGLLLRLRKKYQIYPNTGDPNIDKYLSGERTVDYEYAANGFIMNLSFGMDFMLESGENIHNTSGGFIIGFRTGYILSPFNDGWEMNGIDRQADPSINMKGPYISLVFGSGHIGRSGVFFQ